MEPLWVCGGDARGMVLYVLMLGSLCPEHLEWLHCHSTMCLLQRGMIELQ